MARAQALGKARAAQHLPEHAPGEERGQEGHRCRRPPPQAVAGVVVPPRDKERVYIQKTLIETHVYIQKTPSETRI